MHICEQLTNSTRYLEAHGFTQKQLSTLHHFALKERDITFNLVYRYFGTNKNLQSRNTNFANRVTFVAAQHKRKKGSFSQLIGSALEQWPLGY